MDGGRGQGRKGNRRDREGKGGGREYSISWFTLQIVAITRVVVSQSQIRASSGFPAWVQGSSSSVASPGA